MQITHSSNALCLMQQRCFNATTCRQQLYSMPFELIITYYILETFIIATSNFRFARDLSCGFLSAPRHCWFNRAIITRTSVELRMLQTALFSRFAPNGNMCFFLGARGFLVVWTWNLVCVGLVAGAKNLGAGHVILCLWWAVRNYGKMANMCAVTLTCTCWPKFIIVFGA